MSFVIANGDDSMKLTRRHWMQATAAGIAAFELLPALVAGAPPAAAAPAAGKPPENLMGRCRASLTIGFRRADGDELVRIGEWCRREHAATDTYGRGGLCETFEARVAELLGQPAACFFPTGTMGQLILLRLYADRSGRRTFGAHPSSHHILHELDSVQVLHGIRPVPISPWSRPIVAEDVRRAADPLGAVSVELPLRWTGRLQTWAELEELKQVCREQKIALHMDGARLWDCQPYYGRPLAEICRGFDSVYVSFYKSIGALSGAAIAGPADLVEEARRWRRRHGGDVFQLFPYVASAAMRLGPSLEKMPRWVARARTLAARLARNPRLIVGAAPVPTNLFHVYVRAEPDELERRRDAVARDRGIWVTHGFGAARVPGYADAELHLAEGSDGISDDEAAAAAETILS